MTRLEIHVPGEPIPQDRRARPMTTKTGKAYVGTYLLPAVREWRQAILRAARQTRGFPNEPWTFAVRVTIEAFFERPERLKRKSSPACAIRKNTKPDSDNLVKSVLDALTPPRAKGRIDNPTIQAARRQGYLWIDDGQVHLGPVDRWYVARDPATGLWCSPGVIIIAEPISETEDPDLFATDPAEVTA